MATPQPRRSAHLKVVPPPSAAATAAPAHATDRIVSAITAAIIERRLMPGTKLSEQKLADIFQVSRTLVRQALNQLSRDRLVTLERARGAFVATPSADEARQVFELRAMLETALVRQLCGCITAQQLADLRSHLCHEAAAVARQDVAGRTRLLAEFHVLLARMLHNQVLADLLADLLARSSLISLVYQSAHSAEQSHTAHVQVVDALAQRNARLAVRLMSHHMVQVERGLRPAPRTLDLSTALLPQG